jgi:hypothetical protein
MISLIVRFASATVTGVLAGVWFNDFMAVSPASRTFKGPIYGQVHAALARSYGKKINALVAGCDVAQALNALFARRLGTVAFSLSLSSLACMVIATATTLRVNVPINKQVMQWSSQAPPSNWQELRDRWQRFHVYRTYLTLLSFMCQVAALLTAERD